MTRRTAVLLALATPAAAVPAHDIMLDRLNRFNSTMKDFTAQLRAHQFDCRGAKLLSKLWRDVEHSGEWPT